MIPPRMPTSTPPALTSAPPAAPTKTAPPRRKRAIEVGAVLLVALIGFAGWRTLRAPAGPATSANAQDPAAGEMNAGLSAATPAEAIVHFQKALDVNPRHYGATFQLARALEQAGRKEEAWPIWERALRLAEQYGDHEVAATARARLAARAPADPMAAGLDALHVKRDPLTAAARFREVLAQNPEHYGATYQLATALDQASKPAESRPVWEKMLRMASAIGDATTIADARARLAELDAASGDPAAAPMRAGMELLYTQHDPEAAAVEFRKALALNPEHYGATFQLATALDQAKKPAEARVLWKKVLKMAENDKDAATAERARTRLLQKP
jgi:tetratricopeptide (TPR) repeat protein